VIRRAGTLDAIKLNDKDGKAIRSWPNPPADKK